MDAHPILSVVALEEQQQQSFLVTVITIVYDTHCVQRKVYTTHTVYGAYRVNAIYIPP